MPELATATNTLTAPDLSAPPARPGAGLRRAQAELGRILAHKARCRDLGRPSEAEVARLVAEFLARGGEVRRLDTGHALPIQNGAGRDAERWTL